MTQASSSEWIGQWANSGQTVMVFCYFELCQDGRWEVTGWVRLLRRPPSSVSPRCAWLGLGHRRIDTRVGHQILSLQGLDQQSKAFFGRLNLLAKGRA